MDNIRILQYSLLAGAAYFLCIAIVHVAGIKVPGLFIYYNVNSYQYQDNIISFLAFGWAAFFYAGSGHTEIIKPVLLSAVVALAGLSNNTLTSDFSSINGVETSAIPFWLQIALLCVYVCWLFVFSLRSGLFNSRQ